MRVFCGPRTGLGFQGVIADGLDKFRILIEFDDGDIALACTINAVSGDKMTMRSTAANRSAVEENVKRSPLCEHYTGSSRHA